MKKTFALHILTKNVSNPLEKDPIQHYSSQTGAGECQLWYCACMEQHAACDVKNDSLFMVLLYTKAGHNLFHLSILLSYLCAMIFIENEWRKKLLILNVSVSP